jgi:hypothetical protein
MKRYIKSSDSIITESDYKGALLLLKRSTNSKEIEKAQQIIREYKEKNPELAEKIKSELNTTKRTPRSKSSNDPKTFTSRHIRW